MRAASRCAADETRSAPTHRQPLSTQLQAARTSGHRHGAPGNDDTVAPGRARAYSAVPSLTTMIGIDGSGDSEAHRLSKLLKLLNVETTAITPTAPWRSLSVMTCRSSGLTLWKDSRLKSTTATLPRTSLSSAFA